MRHVAFGQLVAKQEHPFVKFSDPRIESWEPEGSCHWVAVLKESVRETENYGFIKDYCISSITLHYHEEFGHLVAAEVPTIHWKPNWFMFLKETQ
jgi:hypothetical protein